MSNAKVVYTDIAPNANLKGTLFGGRKFWIAQRCPMRSHYKSLVETNGGIVVPLEKQADWLIADHARKDIPVGATSYRFIEACVKAQEMVDSADYACGPPVGTVRDVGSSRPAKGTRNQFTPEDDRFLIRWVVDGLHKGISSTGNKIYQQLEEVNPRHTWQSWRDRWVKKFQDQYNAGKLQVSNSPPTPPSEELEAAPRREPEKSRPRKVEKLPAQVAKKPARAPSPRTSLAAFTAFEFHELFRVADDILSMSVRQAKEAFKTWAGENGQHTAPEWQALWDLRVQPVQEVIEAERGRMRVYKSNWIKWQHQNEDGTADDWFAFWKVYVKPVVEAIVTGEPETEKLDPVEVQEEVKEEGEQDIAESIEQDVSEGKSVIVDDEAAADELQQEDLVALERQKESDMSRPAQSDAIHGRLNPYITQASQPKRYREDDEIQESPVKGSITPDAKRRRTDPGSASKAGQKLNKALHESPTKGQPDDPIGISSSSSSSSDDEDVDKMEGVQAEEKLPEDTPEPEPEDEDVMDEDGQPIDRHAIVLDDFNDEVEELPEEEPEEEYQSTLNRDPSPTLSFRGGLPDLPYQNRPTTPQAPEVSQSKFIEDEDNEDSTLLEQTLQEHSRENEEYDDEERENDEVHTRSSPLPQILDTQAILDAPTQALDFSLPDPDLPRSSPPHIYSTAPEDVFDDDAPPPAPKQSSLQPPQQQALPVPLNQHIANLIAAGHDEANILLSLKSTSMNRELAQVVLQSLEAGRGVPEDTRGVWTPKDDDDAEGGDARMIRRVREKHGERGLAGYVGRLEFLRRWRE